MSDTFQIVPEREKQAAEQYKSCYTQMKEHCEKMESIKSALSGREYREVRAALTGIIAKERREIEDLQKMESTLYRIIAYYEQTERKIHVNPKNKKLNIRIKPIPGVKINPQIKKIVRQTPTPKKPEKTSEPDEQNRKKDTTPSKPKKPKKDTTPTNPAPGNSTPGNSTPGNSTPGNTASTGIQNVSADTQTCLDHLDALSATYSAEKLVSMKYAAAYLLEKGYEPAFVAGVLGNIANEGTAGVFESSNYKSNPGAEPGYLRYMDNNYDYRSKYSGKNIQQIGIAETEALLNKLDGTDGKFGLGSVQWTSHGRAMHLMECYKKVCGRNNYPTQEQCLQAEALMICEELEGDYKSVYDSWKGSSGGADSSTAAQSAGAIICKKYEIPAGAEQKAVTRGNDAANIYKAMIGSN